MRKILFMLIATFALVSCQKELEIDFKSAEQQLVIEATMNEQGTEVSITRTTPIDAPKIDTVRIQSAEVKLMDITANTLEQLHPDTAGIFRSLTPGIVGHQYRLTVHHEGKSYSKIITMAPSALGVDLSFGCINIASVRTALMQVSVTPYPHDTYSYWVRIYRNGKHVAWITACGEMVENGRISMTMMVGTDPNQNSVMVNTSNAMQDGDLISVQVYTIPLEMEDYLNAVVNATYAFPQFDGDFCLGYMVASPTINVSTTYHTNQIFGK